MRFLVYAGENLIGWSALEHSDPPMGCVWGVFYPNEHYDEIVGVILRYQQLCDEGVKGEDLGQALEQVDALSLKIKPEHGEPFESVGGIWLTDYCEELGDEAAREVSVLGLHHETFVAYFKEAHDRYWLP